MFRSSVRQTNKLACATLILTMQAFLARVAIILCALRGSDAQSSTRRRFVSPCDAEGQKECSCPPPCPIPEICCEQTADEYLCLEEWTDCVGLGNATRLVKVVPEDNSKDFVSDAQSSTRRRFVSPCDARGQRECNDPSPELCCEQTADEYLCAEAWTDCVGLSNATRLVKVVAEDNSKDFVAAASSCDSNCKKACKKIDQHCCSRDGKDCLCQLPQFSCASEPSNTTRVVAEDNSKDFVVALRGSDATSPCDSACWLECAAGHFTCCSQYKYACFCQDPKYNCDAGLSNMTRLVKIVAEDNSKDFVAAASNEFIAV